MNIRQVVLLITGVLVSSQYLFSQVAKNVVVEHFTNTRCSICASRNPGFYTNLRSQEGVLHLAVHPSQPYSACLLNRHNTPENDARTQWYGVFGATPRLVIQGEVISSSANYSSSSLFNPYIGKTSPISLQVSVTEHGTDSIQARVSVKTEAAHQLGNLLLFMAIVEEELDYNAPNGERKHHDVFRKSFTGVTGSTFTPGPATGDSVVLTGVLAKNTEWNLSRMYAMVIIQEEASKQVVQADRSANLQAATTGLATHNLLNVGVQPVPASEYIEVTFPGTTPATATLYDIQGRVVKQQEVISRSHIPVAGLVPGIYQLRITGKQGTGISKIIINR